MIDRRDFLKAGAMMAGGRALFAKGLSDVHVGCQTNAWRIDAREFSNVLDVIQKIKNYGYEGFETGFANVQRQFGRAAEAKKQIADIGIRFFGVHIFLNQYDPETFVAGSAMYEKIAEGGAKLGAERLILSGAPPPDEAGRKRKADALNRAGAFAQKLGLTLAYHNHGPEVENHGAEIEFLLRETDPAKVWFLLDAGHAFHAGADVPAFIRKHYRRLAAMHLRDYKNGDQVPLGSGDFPLHAVIETIRQTGWKGWVLNEEERLSSKPGDSAVKPARDALFHALGKED